MVEDGLQLNSDMKRWNIIRPDEEHIELPMDLTSDIELSRAADDDEEVA